VAVKSSKTLGPGGILLSWPTVKRSKRFLMPSTTNVYVYGLLETLGKMTCPGGNVLSWPTRRILYVPAFINYKCRYLWFA
jgi:hypothetical protein